MANTYDPYDYVASLPALNAKSSGPKPNITVKCTNLACRSDNKTIKSTKRAKDFFWRYCVCKECKRLYWFGVQYETHMTVLATATPKVEKTTLLTGNLAFILPAGHPAVTAEYNQFLRTGELPKDVRWAMQEAEEARGREEDAKLQSIVTIKPEDDGPFDEWLASNVEDKRLFEEWLAVNIDKLLAVGYTDDQKEHVFWKWHYAQHKPKE